jgi:hypothetical protein
VRRVPRQQGAGVGVGRRGQGVREGQRIAEVGTTCSQQPSPPPPARALRRPTRAADVIESVDGILAIGSGSDFAEAAAHALCDLDGMTAMDIGAPLLCLGAAAAWAACPGQCAAWTCAARCTDGHAACLPAASLPHAAHAGVPGMRAWACGHSAVGRLPTRTRPMTTKPERENSHELLMTHHISVDRGPVSLPCPPHHAPAAAAAAAPLLAGQCT